MLGQKREKKKESSSSFLIKLYAMINEQNSKYIKWSQDGKSIIILNQNDFAKEVIPQYLNTKNYSSFVKQLTNYNFKKLKIVNKNEEQYINKQFNKWITEEDIKKIPRKPNKVEPGDININEESNLDEETKIQNFQKILKNGELTQNSNIAILSYLLEKTIENNKSKKNVDNINQIRKMKGKILYLIKKNYELKNEIKKVHNEKFVELIKKYKDYKNNKNNKIYCNNNIKKSINVSVNSNSSNGSKYAINIMMMNGLIDLNNKGQYLDTINTLI